MRYEFQHQIPEEIRVDEVGSNRAVRRLKEDRGADSYAGGCLTVTLHLSTARKRARALKRLTRILHSHMWWNPKPLGIGWCHARNAGDVR